jgi:hypothetical protein
MITDAGTAAIASAGRRWSPVPDWASGRRLIWTSLAASLVAAAMLAAISGAAAFRTLGDTDDALRLVRVQGLLHGQPWFHDIVDRIQPPEGLSLHWSRLIDAGVAALIRTFGLIAPGPAAETAARFVWPLIWIFPAALATFALARRLGGRVAVFVCALILPMDLPALLNFHPGRIDHHNVQETLCLAALAFAAVADRRALWGWAAGAASGLGLAIGLEAVPFHAAIAVVFAARLLLEGVPARRPTLAYAAGLGLSTAVFFVLQTPPSLWSATACEALGANLLAGVLVGSAGLAAAAWVRARGAAPAAGVLALGAAAALAVLIWMDPGCVHGPYAHLDPRLQPWLAHVEETYSIPAYWRGHPVLATANVATPLVGLALFAIATRREGRWRDPMWVLMGVLLAGALAMTVVHIRSGPYAAWFALPLIGAGAASLSGRWSGLAVPTALAALVLSPAAVAAASPLIQLGARLSGAAPEASGDGPLGAALPDRCDEPASFRQLAALRPGLVLTEIDLGPFVLAHTPHSVMAAPYHRGARGIVAATTAFGLPPAGAERLVRGLGVSYVVDCPAHADVWDHVAAGRGSLLQQLDRGDAPGWLTRVSPANAPLQVYAVKR